MEKETKKSMGKKILDTNIIVHYCKRSACTEFIEGDHLNLETVRSLVVTIKSETLRIVYM